MTSILLYLLLLSSPLAVDNKMPALENISGLASASIGYSVVDLLTGLQIKSYNNNKVFAPASVLKLFSTALALDILGGNHQQNSLVYTSGNVYNGVLNGDLIIDPNFNPSLGSQRLSGGMTAVFSELQSVLSTQKIQKILGNVVVLEKVKTDDLIPRTWIWEDMGKYFGSPIGSTILNENLLKIYFNTSGAGTQSTIVKTEPELPWLKIENRVLASEINKDLGYAFSRPGDDAIVISGSIPENSNNFLLKAALPNPAKSFAFLLLKELKSKGIEISGEALVQELIPFGIQSIGKINGVSIKEIVKQTNTHSINVWAETLLNIMHQNSKSSESRNDWFEKELAKKFKVDGIRLFDASGLSRFNAVSPTHIVNLLKWMNTHPEKDNFRASLAVAGESGTFKSLLKNSPAKGKVLGKSGYMNGVKCYAGYITTSSGKQLAFSILANNYSISDGELKTHLENWLENIWKI